MSVNPQPISLDGDGYFAGARQLASDARIAFLLLREARGRTCERLFGVSRDDSALVTLIALATLAGAAHSKLHDVIAAPGVPTSSDTFIGAGVLKEAIHLMAGDWSRETPIIPVVIVAAVVGHHLRPWARVSVHDIRAAAHVVRRDFDRRYGHLIRPNRRRRSMAAAVRRAEGAQAPGLHERA